jgi:hypothetical protein
LSPKNNQFSEEKASGLGGFNFWNYLSEKINLAKVREGNSRQGTFGLVMRAW